MKNKKIKDLFDEVTSRKSDIRDNLVALLRELMATRREETLKYLKETNPTEGVYVHYYQPTLFEEMREAIPENDLLDILRVRPEILKQVTDMKTVEYMLDHGLFLPVKNMADRGCLELNLSSKDVECCSKYIMFLVDSGIIPGCVSPVDVAVLAGIMLKDTEGYLKTAMISAPYKFKKLIEYHDWFVSENGLKSVQLITGLHKEYLIEYFKHFLVGRWNDELLFRYIKSLSKEQVEVILMSAEIPAAKKQLTIVSRFVQQDKNLMKKCLKAYAKVAAEVHTSNEIIEIDDDVLNTLPPGTVRKIIKKTPTKGLPVIRFNPDLAMQKVAAHLVAHPEDVEKITQKLQVMRIARNSSNNATIKEKIVSWLDRVNEKPIKDVLNSVICGDLTNEQKVLLLHAYCEDHHRMCPAFFEKDIDVVEKEYQPLKDVCFDCL